jgi:hypothetical protein
LATQPAFSEPFVLLKSGDGKEHKVFKKSALRILLEPSSDVDYHKSHDRLIRVRTFSSSIGGHSNSWEVNNSNLRHLLPDNKIFALGSLFGTLISTDGDGVALCILQCTSIKVASCLVESAPVDEICLSNLAYDIGGQILELVPFRSQPILNPRQFDDVRWIWTSDYIQLERFSKSPRNRGNTTSTVARVVNLNFVVNGRLTYPFTNGKSSEINADLAASMLMGCFEFFGKKLEGRDRTWSFSNIHLHWALVELTQRGQDEDMRRKIPVTGAVGHGRFPYSICDLEGIYSFSIHA